MNVSGNCMAELSKEITSELLIAIDSYRMIAEQLLDTLIAETSQPQKEEIRKGNYYEIQNAPLLNGKETLSDNWYFEVHGEHCMFKSLITEQVIEVFLSTKESTGDLDPFFFHNFLSTTNNFKHLAVYFKKPFHDTLAFFEDLERQKLLVRVDRVRFRRVSTVKN